MLRLNHQESQLSVKDDTGSIDQNRNIMDNDDTSSDLSDSEHFLTKGAFLLTPATELQMERVGMICEKMSYKGPFSLTKTATGILFKFADLEDYQLTFKKGFHKVTGSRFYKKVSRWSYFNYARNFRILKSYFSLVAAIAIHNFANKEGILNNSPRSQNVITYYE